MNKLNLLAQKTIRWITSFIFFLQMINSFSKGNYFWVIICMIFSVLMTIGENTITTKLKINYWIFYFFSLFIVIALLFSDFYFKNKF